MSYARHLGVEPADVLRTPFAPLFVIARGLSAVASAYHGYQRSGRKTGAAVGWGVLGFLFPLITPAVAMVQGYGEPKVRALAANPSRRVVEMRCRCERKARRTSRRRTSPRKSRPQVPSRPRKRPIAKRWELKR